MNFQHPDQICVEVTCSGALSLIEKCSQWLLMMVANLNIYTTLKMAASCGHIFAIGPNSQQPDRVSLEVTCSGALSLIEKCSQRLLMMMMVVG